MALGAAFIEVHADTKPFARELGRELNRILQAAEKDVKTGANGLGKAIADGVNENVNKGLKDNNKNIQNTLGQGISKVFGADLGKKFTEGIINALDDGLSGLPAEVKVALGAVLLALAPFLGAAITGVISAGLAIAFASLGVALASQFEVIQTQWQILIDQLRDIFVRAAEPIVEPLLAAFELIRAKSVELQGWFQEAFAQVAGYIEPIADAFGKFFEGLLPGLVDSLRNIQPVVNELGGAFGELGRVIGEALRIISGSDDASEGFHDLVVVLEVLILSGAVLIRTLTEIYGAMRRVSLLLGGPEGWAQLFAGDAADAQAERVRILTQAHGAYEEQLGRTIAKTEAEEKAVADLNAQIDALTRHLFAAKNNEIAFEQALDDLTLSVKENGRSLDITTQAGRDNASQLLELARIALETRASNIEMGMAVDTAEAAFQKQKAQILALAKQMKLSKADTDKLIGALLEIPPPQKTGVTQGSINSLQNALSLVKALLGLIPGLSAIGGYLGGGAAAHANGGVFSTPHVGLVAEAGPEAIIPLNNPRRAAEVMNEAGLSGMVSPTVNVFIGNQQIDAYIDTRVNQRMAVTARSLAYGGRGI